MLKSVYLLMVLTATPLVYAPQYQCDKKNSVSWTHGKGKKRRHSAGFVAVAALRSKRTPSKPAPGVVDKKKARMALKKQRIARERF